MTESEEAAPASDAASVGAAPTALTDPDTLQATLSELLPVAPVDAPSIEPAAESSLPAPASTETPADTL